MPRFLGGAFGVMDGSGGWGWVSWMVEKFSQPTEVQLRQMGLRKRSSEWVLGGWRKHQKPCVDTKIPGRWYVQLMHLHGFFSFNFCNVFVWNCIFCRQWARIANLKIFHLSTTLCEYSASSVYIEMALNMCHSLYIARPGCGISSAAGCRKGRHRLLGGRTPSFHPYQEKICSRNTTDLEIHQWNQILDIFLTS